MWCIAIEYFGLLSESDFVKAARALSYRAFKATLYAYFLQFHSPKLQFDLDPDFNAMQM